MEFLGRGVRGTYRFTDVDARFGDRLAGLAVEALRQRGGAVAALPGLQGQLVGHFEGLAQRQDDFVRQVLVEGRRRREKVVTEGVVETGRAAASALTTSKAVKTWQ